MMMCWQPNPFVSLLFAQSMPFSTHDTEIMALYIKWE